MNSKVIKPVFLESDKCNGCVSCMKRCPTEAIRVRDGKATVMYERCVGCGECVKACPTNAKKELYDDIGEMKNYSYTIALPPSSLYGQFNNLYNSDFVLNGLKKMGFDEVFEIAAGAEIVSEATRQYMTSSDVVRPVINSACPAITNLIQMRYEHLIPHLSPMQQPEEVAAKIALDNAIKRTGLKRSQIGVFVISPCAAKVADLKKDEASKYIDKILSTKEIYFLLLAEMNKLKEDNLEPLSIAGSLGIGWGCSSGEAIGLETNNFLAVDGIDNVIEVLSELEHDKLYGIDFLALYACPSGCVGGSMNIENPFLARTRLRLLKSKLPLNKVNISKPDDYMRSKPYEPQNIYKLDEDRATAMKLAIKMKQVYESLPKLDCGACGAPRCMAFAEDYIKGVKTKCKYRSE